MCNQKGCTFFDDYKENKVAVCDTPLLKMLLNSCGVPANFIQSGRRAL